MTSYVGFKIVHVLGVVLFMGNIVVTGFWKAIADRAASRTRSPSRSIW